MLGCGQSADIGSCLCLLRTHFGAIGARTIGTRFPEILGCRDFLKRIPWLPLLRLPVAVQRSESTNALEWIWFFFVKWIVYHVSVFLKNIHQIPVDGQLHHLTSKALASFFTLAHMSLHTSHTRIVKDSGTWLGDTCQVFSHCVSSAQSHCSLSPSAIVLHDILRTNANVTSKPPRQSDLFLLLLPGNPRLDCHCVQ